MLPQLKQTMPAAADINIITDRTKTIRASVSDVEFELSLAVVLVVGVIFVFLRSVPATIIPSLSMPLSLVGTFGIMYLAGFSLNNLSLMALTIATGFVVDDAIVMIENISRYIEEGEKPLDAALKGAGQIGFTIISLTVSLLAVLIPLLFMADVVGRLFREFAITLAVTIVISAFVSLTLVPMLCAIMLKNPKREHGKEHEQDPNDVVALNQRGTIEIDDDSIALSPSGRGLGEGNKQERAERAHINSPHLDPLPEGEREKKVGLFQRLINGYGNWLNWVLDHSKLTLLVFFITLGVTALLYVVIPKGFFPVQDTGLIQGISEAPDSASFDSMGDRQVRLSEAILKDPDVESLSSFIGVDGTNTTLNAGRFLINLKDRDKRSDDVSTIIRNLTNETSKVEGIQLYMQPVQDLTIDSTTSRTQYQFVLEDSDISELDTWTQKIVAKLRTLPQLADVASNYQTGGLSAYITIDRDTAGRFGITPATVDNALYDSFGQRIVSTIFTQSNQYRVILEADPSQQSSLDSLNTIYLPAAGGGQVPLSTFAGISQMNAPLETDHLGQFPAATISFNLAPNGALGPAVDAIKKAETDLGVPDSLITSFQGAALAFQQSLGNELLLILAAIVTMYIVLGVLYESYVHPITILSTLPSAGVGALLALLLTGSDLGIIGIIGIILLIGIVKKNAIMMIDFALDAERNEGLSPRDAIHKACLLRFRPILMTTMSALLAALPLMLGTGTGSELRHPLGVSIFGGLIFSQLLTLFTTPVIYLAFENLIRHKRDTTVEQGTPANEVAV